MLCGETVGGGGVCLGTDELNTGAVPKGTTGVAVPGLDVEGGSEMVVDGELRAIGKGCPKSIALERLLTGKDDGRVLDGGAVVAAGGDAGGDEGTDTAVEGAGDSVGRGDGWLGAEAMGVVATGGGTDTGATGRGVAGGGATGGDTLGDWPIDSTLVGRAAAWSGAGTVTVTCSLEGIIAGGNTSVTV